MIPRVAGILSASPGAVWDFLRVTATCFAASDAEPARVLSFPHEEPVVAVVVAEAVRPSVRWWRAPDGSFIVIDGEIYDIGVDGAVAAADGNDAERVFHLHRQHGAAGLARMDAAATIVIWHSGARELNIYRDVDGTVPVFYAPSETSVMFGSETTTLLSAGVPRHMDLRALDFYLSKGYAPAPWTFVEGIRKIPPAHVLTCRTTGAPAVTRYFRQATRPKLSISPADRVERIRDLIAGSLRRRCDPAGRTAVLLSGGVDSATVLASFVKFVGARVEAYTFKYADYDGAYNEAERARKVADNFGVRHETIVCRPADLADGLPQLLSDYGEPFAWGLHTFMLRTLAGTGIEAILTGNEPEWNLRKVDLAAIRFRRLPLPLRAAIRSGWNIAQPLLPRRPAGGRAAGFAAVLRTERNHLPPQLLHASIMNYDLRQSIYVDPELAQLGRSASEELFLAALQEVHDEDPYDQARLLDHRFLDADAIFFWNSVWARSHNLLVRHPYCDRDLRDFFYHLQANMPAKRQLRQFAATLLPDEVVNAPRFPHTIPLGYWFRGPLRAFLLDHLSPARLRDSPFRPDAVARLIKEHLDGATDHTWRLWALLAVLTWRDAVLHAPGSPVNAGPDIKMAT
jgi:asparagine synthase (glutamine-hydrolysing)